MAHFQFLNVGDMVYLTLDKTIYQGKIEALETYERLDNYTTLSLVCFVTKLDIRLANGRLITFDETDLCKEKGISIYPSVEELRKGWRGNRYIRKYSLGYYDNEEVKRYISQYIDRLKLYGFVIDRNNIMPVFYKNDGIKVVEKRMKYIVNHHDEILDEDEFEFLSHADNAKPHTLDEWLEGEWFTTYEEAYKSITPEVVMFEEPKTEPKYTKNFVVLDVTYNLWGEAINESVFCETNKFEDAVAIASLAMHNEVNELFNFDDHSPDDEAVFYHQYKVYEVYNGELNPKQIPLFKTECYVKQ